MSTELRYQVYRPPDYDRSTASYPTLYLLHGRGDDEHSWLNEGHVEAVVNDAIASRRVAPLLIVMPYGFIRPQDQDVKAKRYLSPPPQELRPVVDRIMADVEGRYRVLPGREHQAIAGVSMGSEQALDLVF